MAGKVSRLGMRPECRSVHMAVARTTVSGMTISVSITLSPVQSPFPQTELDIKHSLHFGWPDHERANQLILFCHKLAAAASTRRQTAGCVANGRGDISAERCHRTDNAEGYEHQQQRVLGRRGALFFLHQPTNRIQHGIVSLIFFLSRSPFPN